MQQYSVKLIIFFWLFLIACGDFPSGSVVKNPPAKAGDTGDLSSIPGSEMATHSSILAWRIPGTEEPHGLQPRGLRRAEHN